MQPGSLKLGTYLIDGKTIAMYTAGVVRSVTYKATLYGPNIPKAEAIANSEAWEQVEFDAETAAAALDDLPTADWDAAPPTPSSSAGSSASHAATPPSRGGAGRGAGRGRGRA